MKMTTALADESNIATGMVRLQCNTVVTYKTNVCLCFHNLAGCRQFVKFAYQLNCNGLEVVIVMLIISALCFYAWHCMSICLFLKKF